MMAAMRFMPEDSSEAAYNLSDVQFMDDVLEAWALDAHQQSVRLGYPEAGNIWGLMAPVTHRWVLNLDAQQLMIVDRQIVKLPWRDRDLRCRKAIFVEYFSRDPQGIKAQRFGLSVRTYHRRLKELQQYLYDQLSPGIEEWSQRVRG